MQKYSFALITDAVRGWFCIKYVEPTPPSITKELQTLMPSRSRYKKAHFGDNVNIKAAL